MRVLLVSSLYPPRVVGGAELSVQELAEELVAEGCQVSVLALRPGGSAADDGFRYGRVDVRELELPGPWVFDASFHGRSSAARLLFHVAEAWRPTVVTETRRLLGELAPDVVHTHTIAGFGTSIWSAVTGPLLHTMHDYWLLCPRNTMNRHGRQCAGLCLDCRVTTLPRRHPRRRPDAYTAVSSHVIDVHRTAGFLQSGDAVEVVPNGVSVVVPERTIDAVRRIGYIGRLEPTKGLPVLLAAIAGDPELADVEVVVAGRGSAEDLAGLDRWRAEGVRVNYIGFTPVDRVLDQVDCVCVPSQWAEAYGRVAAEARAARLPVVASRTGGLVDALAGYDCVRLVDDFTFPAAWAEALRDVRATAPGRRVGSTPRTGSAVSTRRYLDLYRRLSAR